MLKTVSAALAASLIAIASPSVARTAVPAPANPAQDVAPVTKPTRYCVVDTPTGSRLPHRVCQTREQWLAQGFDPLKK